MTAPAVAQGLSANGLGPSIDYSPRQEDVFRRLEVAALAIEILDGPGIGLPPGVRKMLHDQVLTAYPDAGEEPSLHAWFQWDLAAFRRWYWMNVGALLDSQADVLEEEHDALIDRYWDEQDALDLSRYLGWWHQIHRGEAATDPSTPSGPAAGEERAGGTPTPADVYFSEVVEPVLWEAGVSSIDELRTLTRTRHPVFAFIENRVSWDAIGGSRSPTAVLTVVEESLKLIREAIAVLRDRAEDARWADNDGSNWRYWEPVLQLTALLLFPKRQPLAELCVRMGMERVSATPADVAVVAGAALGFLAGVLASIASAGTVAPATLGLLAAWTEGVSIGASVSGPLIRMFEVRDVENVRVVEQLGTIAPLVGAGESPETELVVAIVMALAGLAIGRIAAGKSRSGRLPRRPEPWTPQAPKPRRPGAPPAARAIERPVPDPSSNAVRGTAPQSRGTEPLASSHTVAGTAEGPPRIDGRSVEGARSTPRIDARAAWESDVAEDIGLVRGERRPTTPPVTGTANEERIERLLDRSKMPVSRDRLAWFNGVRQDPGVVPKGSSIPDFEIEGITDSQRFYIELKSYARVLNSDPAIRARGIYDLVRTTVGQLNARLRNLPPNSPQYVLIDLSGRQYGRDVVAQVEYEIRRRLVDQASGIITGENVAFFD